jgi:predicted alpha/beta hydrolase
MSAAMRSAERAAGAARSANSASAPHAPSVEQLPMPSGHRDAAPLAFWPAASEAGGAAVALAPGPAALVLPALGPAALVLPALGVPAGAYRRLAEALSAAGTPTGVAEWRGGGASPVRASRRSDWGYLDLFQHEVQGGIAALRERLAGRPVAVVGHSLGGHLGLMARAQAVPGLAGVLTVASGTPTLRFFAPKLRLQLRFVLSAHGVTGPLLGYFPGHRIGFGGRQPRQLMDEWALLARLGRFEIGGRNLLEPRSEAARRLPVRSLSLPHDIYAPRAATEHLLQLAGVGPEAVERFEGPGPLGHFDWLKEPRALAGRMHALLAAWI